MDALQSFHILLQLLVILSQIIDMPPKLLRRFEHRAATPKNNDGVALYSLQSLLKSRHGGPDFAHARLTEVSVFAETQEGSAKPLERRARHRN